MTTPAVFSVEKFSISMPNATVSTPALSLGQDIDHCVPFITVSSDNQQNGVQMIDVQKNASTNKFDFTCSATGARNLEVTIVEFDPAEVTVQQVAFTLGSGLTANVTVTAVVEANTFPIIYAETAADSSDDFNDILYRATFTSTTNLLITKISHNVDLTGHAFILEALNGAWAIETGASIPAALATDARTSNTTISVTANLTGLWSYWSTSETSDDPRDAVWDSVITNATNLDRTRANGGGNAPAATCDMESFVVNFAAEVALVQQGEFDYLTATTKTAAISAPTTLDDTMIVATNVLGWCEGTTGTTLGKDFDQGRMSFNSATEVLGTRDGVGAGNYIQNFQVIEWFLGSRPAVNPAVISVEKFSISMTAETASTPALSLGQAIDNCVPFVTISTASDRGDSQAIDIQKNGGTNKFDIATPAFAEDIELEITIVEFDPAEVNVQEVAFTLGATNTVDITIDAVKILATFPIIYAKFPVTSSNDNFDNHMFRASVETTTNLRLDKEAHSDNLVGHAYILEALNRQWVVSAHTFTFLVGSVSENDTIAVTPGLTGLWSYWDVAEQGDDVRDGVWDAAITDSTNLDLTRGNSAGVAAVGDIEAFVVNFADTVAVVQQGEFNYITATTKTAAISAPSVLANAMVVGTSVLGWCEGSGTTNPKAAGLGRMSFNSSTEVLGTRSGTGDGNYRQNFQVIEWLIASDAAGSKPVIITLGF